MTRKYFHLGLAAAVALLLLTPAGDLAWSATRHAVGGSHKAEKATRGPRGPRGRRGPRGFRGPRGLRGLRGATGLAGTRGIQGAKGLKGDTGTRGTTIGLLAYCARAKANPYAYPDAPCRAQSYAVDTQDNVGWTPSIEIGTDGNPLISYIDVTNQDLKLARCKDRLCSGGVTLSTVDSTGNVSSDSLAVGLDGNPVISYLVHPSLEFKVVHCNDPACAGGDETPHTIAQGVGSPLYNCCTAIAIASDGDPTVTFQRDGSPRVVHCNDPACAGGDETANTVDGGLKGSNSLALGADGNPVIAYFDAEDHYLTVARCNDPACAPGGDTVTTVDSGDVGYSNSLVIGADGNPVIAYIDQANHTVKVARCNDPGCTGHDETLSTVDAVNSSGFYDSAAVGEDGNPVIAYFSSTGHLNVARCNDPACAGHNEALATADSAPQVGQFPSIAIGLDGGPVIAHWDGTNGDLRVSRPAIP